MRRRIRYLINGVLLALGAPAGLLLLHALTRGGSPTPTWVLHELHENAADYTYLTFSTVTVFAILSLLLGTREEQLEASALTDPLTGLWNRRHALRRLDEELARAKRYRQPLSVLFIDVDWLKQINDQGGHSVGDGALKQVAEAIRSSCRAVDVAARFGGDEYLVIASSTGADGASLGERIRVAAKRLTNDALTVSVGVAEFDATQHTDASMLCQAADDALYEAKKQGRNCVVLAAAAKPTAATASS